MNWLDQEVQRFSGSMEERVDLWLQTLNFHFNPYKELNAANDPNLTRYLIENEAFNKVWGNHSSLVFKPPGGGKTALRICIAQECYVGQETNRPFPVSYTPPFMRWTHAEPTLEDHMNALLRAGVTQLILTLIYRPHWFFRLAESARQKIRHFLHNNFDGSLPHLLDLGHEPDGIQLLKTRLQATVHITDEPDHKTLTTLCRLLKSEADIQVNQIDGNHKKANHKSRIEEQWTQFTQIILDILQFESIYILLDGLDEAPETVYAPHKAATVLTPLLHVLPTWEADRIYLKCFLPDDLEVVMQTRFANVFDWLKTTTLQWTSNHLLDLLRQRTLVATDGDIATLNEITSPALADIDIEAKIVESTERLPRHVLLLTQRVFKEHVLNSNHQQKIQKVDITNAIQWYNHQSHYIIN